MKESQARELYFAFLRGFYSSSDNQLCVRFQELSCIGLIEPQGRTLTVGLLNE
jgi:hypothetical protein